MKDTVTRYKYDVFKLKRKTNIGTIVTSPQMTWMEMAILQKITNSSSFSEIYLGNPKNYKGKSCWSKKNVKLLFSDRERER